jgi:hypothetical protein
MTESTTLERERAPEPVKRRETVGAGPHGALRDRLLLPLLVPVLSTVAVGLLAVNLSRVFLAGTSEAALISAVVITVAILGGAAIVSVAPGLRTSSLAMVAGLVFVIVLAAGLLTLGPSLGHDDAGPGPPLGPTDATLEVVATPGLSFNGERNAALTSPAGVIEIVYSGEPGHTLAFRDPRFAGFLLDSKAPSRAKVRLAPGTYELYCTVGVHAPNGMEATLTVAG